MWPADLQIDPEHASKGDWITLKFIVNKYHADLVIFIKKTLVHLGKSKHLSTQMVKVFWSAIPETLNMPSERTGKSIL